MKRIIFSMILMMVFFTPEMIKAQIDTIPNGDFEFWAKDGKDIAKPIGWIDAPGSTDSVRSVVYKKGAATITRPVYDGKYAIMIPNLQVGQGISIGDISTRLNWKNQDPYLLINMAYIQGEKKNYPSFTVMAWKKNATQSSDTCINQIFGLKGNGVNGTLDTTIEPWTTLVLPLKYTSTTMPDTGAIYILSANNLVALDTLQLLYIEKMWFASTAPSAGIEAISLSGINSLVAYPNPFNTKTKIQYNLSVASNITLSIFDMQGREISKLVNGYQAAGMHDVTFNSDGLQNGIYFYRLQTNIGVETGKLMLSK